MSRSETIASPLSSLIADIEDACCETLHYTSDARADVLAHRQDAPDDKLPKALSQLDAIDKRLRATTTKIRTQFEDIVEQHKRSGVQGDVDCKLKLRRVYLEFCRNVVDELQYSMRNQNTVVSGAPGIIAATEVFSKCCAKALGALDARLRKGPAFAKEGLGEDTDAQSASFIYNRAPDQQTPSIAELEKDATEPPNIPPSEVDDNADDLDDHLNDLYKTPYQLEVNVVPASTSAQPSTHFGSGSAGSHLHPATRSRLEHELEGEFEPPPAEVAKSILRFVEVSQNREASPELRRLLGSKHTKRENI